MRKVSSFPAVPNLHQSLQSNRTQGLDDDYPLQNLLLSPAPTLNLPEMGVPPSPDVIHKPIAIRPPGAPPTLQLHISPPANSAAAAAAAAGKEETDEHFSDSESSDPGTNEDSASTECISPRMCNGEIAVTYSSLIDRL